MKFYLIIFLSLSIIVSKGYASDENDPALLFEAYESTTGDLEFVDDTRMADYNVFDVDALVGDDLVNARDGFFDDDDVVDVGKELQEVPTLTELQLNSASIGTVMPEMSTRFGLYNHGNTCYMNAFVSCFYNIELLRSRLFSVEPTTASSVMLAEVLARMQSAAGPVASNLSLMPAVSRELQWEFGQFECILEFAVLFLDKLPQPVLDTMKMTARQTFHRRSDGLVIKHKDEVSYVFTITPRFNSLQAAITEGFVDMESEPFVIEVGDYEHYTHILNERPEGNVQVPSYNTYTIVDRPEVLAFGLRRANGLNPLSPDSSHMTLDFEITLSATEEAPETKYVLKAFSFYVPGHYMSYTRDLSQDSRDGDWYLYNDARVCLVQGTDEYFRMLTFANTAATLAFYVRSDIAYDLGKTVAIPDERTLTLARLMNALSISHQEKEAKARAAAEARFKEMQAANEARLRQMRDFGFGNHSAAGSSMQSTRPSAIMPDVDARQFLARTMPQSLDVQQYRVTFPLDEDYFSQSA